MIHTLKYIILQIPGPKITLPTSDMAKLLESIDLLILAYKGAYYGIPKHEMDNYSMLAFDTAARVKFNPKRGRQDPIVSFDVARLPVIPTVLISEAFVSSTKKPYDLDQFRKSKAQSDGDPKQNP
jgi:hypothetical protein